MTPLAALLVAYPFAVVTVDLPDRAHDALVGECATGIAPYRNLHHVEVWGVRQGSRHPVLVRAKQEVGMEGKRDTVHLPITAADGVWTVWCVFVSKRGSPSCESNRLGINLTVSAPSVGPLFAPRVEWFDLAGRRLSGKPERAGVYFTRRGSDRARIVILK